jgi:hypothetical protein
MGVASTGACPFSAGDRAVLDPPAHVHGGLPRGLLVQVLVRYLTQVPPGAAGCRYAGVPPAFSAC